jgi:lipid II:glycine glycyltransferase (peptidoglycan interpeptide bridge formation enzyme)
MIHIKRRKFLIPINEFYFYDSELDIRPNLGLINIFIQAKNTTGNGKNKKISTLLIDLKQDEDKIFSNIKKKFRYDIRQAWKNNITFNWNSKPSIQNINEFCSFYNSFAKQAGVGKSNKIKLKILQKENSLILSTAQSDDGRKLVMHALISDGARVRLLYSGSLHRSVAKEDRNLIGKANKALHWYEVKESKYLQARHYDFGGLSTDNSTKNIDQFKLSFGGEVVNEFNVLRIMRF